MSDTTNDTETGAPAADAATDPVAFWQSGGGIDQLADPRPFGHENALQKLGRPPFDKSARSKFRLLGFLATVYEHVRDDVNEDGGAPEEGR